jgi:tetratricopeptide (TPR) repeat protein
MATDQTITGYESALSTLEQSADPQFAPAALPVLLARDKVALALEEETPGAAAFKTLTNADERLAKLAPKFDSIIKSETLDTWRQSVLPDESAWWWHLDDLAKSKQTGFKRLSTIIAIFLVTASIAVFADTFNVLRNIGANPISTLGVLVQGALAFIAASAFTEAGRNWLIDKFSRFGNRTFKGWGRTGLSFAVFLTTLLFWFVVPIGAAWYFHRVGDRYFGEGLYEQAANSYRQASSLRPYVISYHWALAKAEEKSTNFDKAISEYKSMSALYERPGTKIDDAYFLAKCDLVRLLISQDKNYALAESTMNDLQKKIGQVSEPNRLLVQYFLFTYQGWIELERRNLPTAKRELEFMVNTFCDGPTARYLLARVLEEQAQAESDKNIAAGLKTEAKSHYSKFLQLLQRPQPDEIPLDWISLAQERTTIQ